MLHHYRQYKKSHCYLDHHNSRCALYTNTRAHKKQLVLLPGVDGSKQDKMALRVIDAVVIVLHPIPALTLAGFLRTLLYLLLPGGKTSSMSLLLLDLLMNFSVYREGSILSILTVRVVFWSGHAGRGNHFTY